MGIHVLVFQGRWLWGPPHIYVVQLTLISVQFSSERGSQPRNTPAIAQPVLYAAYRGGYAPGTDSEPSTLPSPVPLAGAPPSGPHSCGRSSRSSDRLTRGTSCASRSLRAQCQGQGASRRQLACGRAGLTAARRAQEHRNVVVERVVLAHHQAAHATDQPRLHHVRARTASG